MSDKSPQIVALIMAGGAGTRFWPLSTEERPKQFLRLFGERSLLQLSYDRVAPLVSPERVMVLTSAKVCPPGAGAAPGTSFPEHNRRAVAARYRRRGGPGRPDR